MVCVLVSTSGREGSRKGVLLPRKDGEASDTYWAKGMPLKDSTSVTAPIIVTTGAAIVTVGVARFSRTGAAMTTE